MDEDKFEGEVMRSRGSARRVGFTEAVTWSKAVDSEAGYRDSTVTIRQPLATRMSYFPLYSFMPFLSQPWSTGDTMILNAVMARVPVFHGWHPPRSISL